MTKRTATDARNTTAAIAIASPSPSSPCAKSKTGPEQTTIASVLCSPRLEAASCLTAAPRRTIEISQKAPKKTYATSDALEYGCPSEGEDLAESQDVPGSGSKFSAGTKKRRGLDATAGQDPKVSSALVEASCTQDSLLGRNYEKSLPRPRRVAFFHCAAHPR